MDQQTVFGAKLHGIKKILKIAGIAFLAVIIFGLWNIISGDKKISQQSSDSVLNYDYRGDKMAASDYLESPTSSPDESSRMMSGSLESSEIAAQENLVEKKVIKNGNLSLKVKKTQEAVAFISEVAKAKGGEIFSTNLVERVKGTKSGTVVVKVPVAQFESAISEIKKIATQVVIEYTSGQDVTEQYTDLQAQLKNKQAEEQSFVKILDQSGKIDDILAVTREISRVRGEIERLQGRIRFLESQTDMSTITVSLSEDAELAPVGSGWRPGQVFKQSIQDLVKGAQNFVDGLIKLVILGLPSIILFVIIFFMIWKVAKKVVEKIRNK